jgi:hypothetical protein
MPVNAASTVSDVVDDSASSVIVAAGTSGGPISSQSSGRRSASACTVACAAPKTSSALASLRSRSATSRRRSAAASPARRCSSLRAPSSASAVRTRATSAVRALASATGLAGVDDDTHAQPLGAVDPDVLVDGGGVARGVRRHEARLAALERIAGRGQEQGPNRRRVGCRLEPLGQAGRGEQRPPARLDGDAGLVDARAPPTSASCSWRSVPRRPSASVAGRAAARR